MPLPDAVAGRLREHAEEFEPVPVTLPWGTRTRLAIDSAFGHGPDTPDGLTTA